MAKKRSRIDHKEKARQKRRELAFTKMLNTPDRRQYFSNSHPLILPEDPTAFPNSLPRWKLSELNLKAFPEIEDFRIATFKSKGYGYHLAFKSPAHGVLTSFPWWDHVDKDMAKGIQEIPMGTIQNPFYDLEQGWQLLIFLHEDQIYILQGKEPGDNNFQTWYRVDLDRYLSEWNRVREKFKP